VRSLLQKDAGYDWRKTFMNEQRGLVVHEGDADEEVHWVYIPFSEVRKEPSRHPAFGITGLRRLEPEEPVIGRRTYLFKNTEGQNVNVIEAQVPRSEHPAIAHGKKPTLPLTERSTPSARDRGWPSNF
jgi:hypothetical protein